MSRSLSILILALLGVGSSMADDSPRFRGRDGNGFSAIRSFPDEWSTDENDAWSVAIPGGGWSSPIVVGDLVLVTTAVSGEAGKPKGYRASVLLPPSMGRAAAPPSSPVNFLLLGIDLTSGSVRWTRRVAAAKPPYPIHPSNTYATETPASDGERVFAYFGAIGQLTALDLAGEELWKQDVGTYPMNGGFGTGSSLAVGTGLIYVLSDNEQSSFMVAFDAKSGEERWRRERAKGSAWSTPTIWESKDGTVLVAGGPGHVTAYDPMTGETVWKLGSYPGSFTASPIWTDDRFILGSSGPLSRGPLMAIQSGAKGEITYGEESEAVVWNNDRSGPGMASPVLHQGLLYVIGSGGILACYDVSDGDQVYRERLPESSNMSASLWAAGDRVFLLDEEGQTLVIRAGREFEIVRRNVIDDLFWSTPTLAGDRLLLRGANKLYCIHESKADDSAGQPSR